MFGKFRVVALAVPGAAVMLTGCGSRLDLGVPLEPDAGSNEGPDAGKVEAGIAPDGQAPSADAGNLLGDAGVLRTWSWVAPKPPPYPVRALFGDSSDDVWLIGDHGMVAHWDGKSAVEVVLEGSDSEVLNAGWANGPDDVWATGLGGILTSNPDSETTVSHHWDGVRWTSYYAGLDRPSAFWGSGKDDVWALNQPFSNVSVPPNLVHWDGTSWTQQPLPLSVDDRLTAIWGSAADDVWMVGTSVWHFDGHAWTSVADGLATAHWANSVWGSAGDDVWVSFDAPGPGSTDQQSFEHWDGKAWTVAASATLSSSCAGYAVPLWGASPDRIYAGLGLSGCDWFWDGQQWTQVNDGLAVLWAAPGGDAIGSGSGGLFDVPGPTAGSKGPVWQQQPLFSAFPDENVAARQVSSDSNGDVWSVVFADYEDDNGALEWIGNAESSLSRWSGVDWTPVPTPFAPASVFVDSSGDVWIGETPAPTVPYAIPRLAYYDGARWMTVPSPPTANTLAGPGIPVQMAGTGPDDAWAVLAQNQTGDYGQSPASHWDGTRWTPLALGDAVIGALAPVRANLAWLSGIEESTQDMVVYRWDGTQATEAFRRSAQESMDVSGIWSSGDDCVWVSGHPTMHFDGGSWTAMDMQTNGVWGTGPNDVWLIENPGTIVHWDGTLLSVVKETDLPLVSIAGNAREVWVSGERGATLRLAGATGTGGQ